MQCNNYELMTLICSNNYPSYLQCTRRSFQLYEIGNEIDAKDNRNQTLEISCNFDKTTDYCT